MLVLCCLCFSERPAPPLCMVTTAHKTCGKHPNRLNSLDGAPYHGSQVVKEFVESHSERISIERLPAFSPDFNPIEKLWKNTKKEATHCKYFETFEELRESVFKAFGKFLNDATKVIGVMKKLRSEAEAISML